MTKLKLKFYKWLTNHTVLFVDYNDVELIINDYLVGEHVYFNISHDAVCEERKTANGMMVDKIVKQVKVNIKYDSIN